jgi:hypothetical protein
MNLPMAWKLRRKKRPAAAPPETTTPAPAADPPAGQGPPTSPAERIAAFLAGRAGRAAGPVPAPAPVPAGGRVTVTESAAMGRQTTVTLPARDTIDLRPGAPGWSRSRGVIP